MPPPPGAHHAGLHHTPASVRLGGHDYRIRRSRPPAVRRPGPPCATRRHLFGAMEPVRAGLAFRPRVGRSHERLRRRRQRILELGCGLACPVWCCSVAAPMSSPATTTRWPTVPRLQRGTQRSSCRGLPRSAVGRADATLGRFDLIIGSDVLYERDHADLLAAMMLAYPRAIRSADHRSGPRQQRAVHARARGARLRRGRTARPHERSRLPPFRGRLLSYRRSASGPVVTSTLQ